MYSSLKKTRIARLCAITGIVLATTMSASADGGGTWGAGSWTPNLGDNSASPTALDGAVRCYHNIGDGQCYAGGRFNQPYNNIAFWDGSEWQDTGQTFWSGDSSANAITEYEGKLYAAGRFVNSQGAVCLLVRLEEELGFPGLWRWAPVHYASSSVPESQAFALEVHDGNLVMGGSFRDQNGKTNLVAYNGSEFVVLGADTADGPVYALASRDSGFHPSKLFAGGSFTNIGSMVPGIGGGPPINTEKNLAVFQSGQWTQALGPADDTVYALHDVSMDLQKILYIGGKFDEIDGVSGLQGIARHTGFNIADLSGGTGGTVYAIQGWSGGLAVGGDFTIDVASDDTAFNVASWSSNSGWSSLNDGVEGSVIDGEMGAPVLALCRYNEALRRGVYAGGNFRTCGADLDTFTNYAARFAQSFESNANYESDWVADSSNVTFEAFPPLSLLASPFNPGQTARFNWGIGNASAQRLGFGSQGLMLEAPIDFTAIWKVQNPPDARIDFSIFRPGNPGPFLPDPSVIEFRSYDLSGNVLHGLQFEAVTADAQVRQLDQLTDPAAFGATIETEGNIRSITTTNGNGAYDKQYLIIEFDAPSLVYYRNPGEDGMNFDQYIDNVTRLQLVTSEPLAGSEDWSSNIEVAFNAPVMIDRLDCGFGHQGNRHSLTSGDLGIAIGTGDLPAYDLSSESAGSLEISGAEDHTAETYGDAAYERMGLSFQIIDAEINSSIRIEAKAGIAVGNPADLPEEKKTNFTIARSDFSTVHIMHEPLPVFQGQTALVQLLSNGEVVREYLTGSNAMSLEVIDAFNGQVLDASVDFEQTSSIVQWTDPRLVVLHDPMFEDEIIEADITGWRLQNPVEESDPDGDGIADQIKPVSLEVDMNQFMNVRIFDERFKPLESQPETSPADFNGDGSVDGSDLGHLLGEWGFNPGSTADLNGDGMVDGSDMGMFLSYWF